MAKEPTYTRPVRLVVRPETYEAAERKAAELGMKPATWMRWALEQATGTRPGAKS